jgi:hypothetical protein
MWCNQIFSLISDSIVQNIIVCDNYELANEVARIQYGNEAYAVDTTHYPLSIGFKHIDGFFYEEDGITEVFKNPTADEDAKAARDMVNYLEIRQTETELDIDYRMSMIELGLL